LQFLIFSTVDEVHKNVTKILLFMAYLDNEIVTDAKCIHIASSKLMEIPFTKGYQMQFTGTSATSTFFADDDTTEKVESLRFPLMQTEQFSSFTSLQKNFFRSLIKLETNSQSTNPYRVSNQIGMLPINLNLEIDGLSGIRIYDQINVDTRFLPSYYPNYLIFIIKGVSHSFNGNRWVTKIDTIAQPKVAYQKDLELEKKFSYGELSVPDDIPQTPIITPNADRLRSVLDELGYVEKGEEISEAGDITTQMADVSIAVFREIKTQLPNLGIRVTSGNDVEHASITDYVSLHTTGNALDFVIDPSTESNQKIVVQILNEFAADPINNFSYIDEYSDPTKNATGYHYHLVIGGGPTARKNRQKAIALANAGKIFPRNAFGGGAYQQALDELNRPF